MWSQKIGNCHRTLLKSLRVEQAAGGNVYDPAAWDLIGWRPEVTWDRKEPVKWILSCNFDMDAKGWN